MDRCLQVRRSSAAAAPISSSAPTSESVVELLQRAHDHRNLPIRICGVYAARETLPVDLEDELGEALGEPEETPDDHGVLLADEQSKLAAREGYRGVACAVESNGIDGARGDSAAHGAHHERHVLDSFGGSKCGGAALSFEASEDCGLRERRGTLQSADGQHIRDTGGEEDEGEPRIERKIIDTSSYRRAGYMQRARRRPSIWTISSVKGPRRRRAAVYRSRSASRMSRADWPLWRVPVGLRARRGAAGSMELRDGTPKGVHNKSHLLAGASVLALRSASKRVRIVSMLSVSMLRR
ncbi:hypothetical protein B0H11DRAFT_2019705 [Mycena galericulata]|nr:hypothetical protein B0H11DRAFT_2019705 [Mycena galericulata]